MSEESQGSQPTTPERIPSPSEQAELAVKAWADAPNPDEDAPAPSETTGEEPVVSQEAGEAQPEVDNDPPPEFWSQERKAQWAKITDPEVRAAIKGHVEDANKAISGKMEEAAKTRKAAEEAARQYQANQEQLAAWWQQNGQKIGAMVQGKWAGVDWNKLSAENPAEWARLRQTYESEMTAIRDMQAKHEAEVKAVEARQQQAHQQERLAEHQKLAAKYPDEFGGEKADATYKTLSEYVISQGISPQRLAGIYEAPVVEIIQKAYKYDQIQKKAKEVTSPKPAEAPARTTPTRVVPGAATRSANPIPNVIRQAEQRLMKGEKLDRDTLAAAFR